MERCFVIQPFDGGEFDDRFDQVITPAVEAAGLVAYRVDRDPSVSIPIEDIESGIRDARVCLADITHDNPNIWFELGFAIAADKEVVLICSKGRTEKFPFDVQHRSIIRYRTASPGDFSDLSTKVTARIQAALKKDANISSAASISKLTPIDGLEQIEVVALAAIAENLDGLEGEVSYRAVRGDMERSGITGVAATIALRSLLERGFIESGMGQDYNSDPYPICTVTTEGWRWITGNKHRFAQEKPAKSPKKINVSSRGSVGDEEIPF